MLKCNEHYLSMIRGTSTSSNDTLGVAMRVEYTASPGRIEINTTLEGKLGISSSDALNALRQRDLEPAMTVRYQLERGPQAVLESLVNQIEGTFGIPAESILGGASSASQVDFSGLGNIGQDRIDLWVGIREVGPLNLAANRFAGSDPASTSRTITYNAPTLRIPPSVSEPVDNVPPVRIEVIATPSAAGIQNFFGGDIRTTITIPFREIVNIEEVSERSCGEVYPEIERSINGLSSEIDSLLSEQNLLSEVSRDPGDIMVDGGFFSGVSNAVSDAVGGGVTGDRDTSIVGGGITRDASTSVRDGGLTGDPSTSIVGGGLTGDVSTSVTDEGFTGDPDTNVVGQALNRGITGDADTSVADRFRQQAEEPEPAVQRVDTGTFEEATRPEVDTSQIDTLDISGSFFDRARTIASEIRATESEVREQVTVQGCRERYMSTLSELRDLLGEVFDLQDRVVDCASDYSAIARRVNRLERRVSDVDVNSVGSITNILQNASQLQSDISNQVDSNECVQEFRSRTNSVVNRLQNYEGGINCASEYRDLDNRIGRIRNRAFSLNPQSSFRDLPSLEEVNNDLEEARDVRSDINQRVDDQECFSEFISSIRGAINRLENVKETVDIDCESEFPQLSREVESVLSTAERLRTLEDAGQTVSERQAEGLEGSIQSANDQIDRLADIQQCKAEFRTKVDDAETILRTEVNPEPDLSCDDVPGPIRTTVESIRQEAAQFSDRVPREAAFNEAQSLLEDARSVRSRIQEDVREANPCRSQLLSDIDTAIQRLQTFNQREPVPVACSEKFPELTEMSKQLQRNASDLRGTVSANELVQFIEDAKEVETRIEEEIPEDDRCFSRLLSRVEASVKRVQSAAGGTRSITESEAGDLLPGIGVDDISGNLSEIEGPELEELRQRVQDAQSSQ